MKKYIIIGVAVLIFVLSIIIGGPNWKKMVLNIKDDSIPKTLEPGDIFTVELETNLDKKNIQFTSSNEEIASVNNEGLVTVFKKGEVTITVSTVYEEEKPLTDSVKIKIGTK